MRKTGFIALLLGLFLIAGSALADVLVLKDGRRIEGIVLEETAAKVRIQTGLGLLEFKRSEIETIERKKTKRQQFDERYEAAETGDDFHEVGLWAESKRLRKQAKKAMNRAIEVDSDHIESRCFEVLADARSDAGARPGDGRAGHGFSLAKRSRLATVYFAAPNAHS